MQLVIAILDIKEIIKNRKSVRTFEDRPLSQEDQKALKEYINTVSNPFGVPVTFELLNSKENELSSAVIVGAQMYVAGKVGRMEDYEMAYGYTFEKICLYALSKGIGTIMLAASLSRKSFEAAMKLADDEVMPAASPVGYPAEKRSIRDNLMRKGLKADSRKPFNELFFKESFENGLSMEEANVFGDALELARWAPSAGNGQPWRAVVDGDKVHFYEAKAMKDSKLGDIQKLDVGIAMSHFELALEADGIRGNYFKQSPGFDAPENVHYLISFKRES